MAWSVAQQQEFESSAGYMRPTTPESLVEAARAAIAAHPGDGKGVYDSLAASGFRFMAPGDIEYAIQLAGGVKALAQAASSFSTQTSEGSFLGDIAKFALGAAALGTGVAALGGAFTTAATAASSAAASAAEGAAATLVEAAGSIASGIGAGIDKVVSGVSDFVSNIGLGGAAEPVITEEAMSISTILRDAAKGALQGVVGEVFNGNGGTASGRAIYDYGPMYGNGGYTGLPAAMPVAFPMVSGLIGGAARVLPRVGGAIVGAGARLIGGVTRKKAVALAKVIGIQAAAAALGVGAIEIAQAVMDDAARKRRGRGVTAAQLRTTRRTMRKVMGMAKQIRSACSETGFMARRRAAPKVYCAPRKR